MSLAVRREEFRAAIPRWYRGWVHFTIINLVVLVAIGACLRMLVHPATHELLVIPATFLFANLFEWWVHRGPMHHRTRLFPGMYDRHTKTHHVVFTLDAMAYRDDRDLYYVLFPPYFLPLMLTMASPIPLALGAFVSRDLAWLFLASALGYYLVYEWLHTLHHLAPDSSVGSLGPVRWLRRPHSLHHDPKRMTHGNFNVSFPLADWILGTRLPDEDEA